MTTRLQIEEALAPKSSQEQNDFFESLGFYRVNPATQIEEERKKQILKYQLDLADRRPDMFTKICRGLGLPTPQERMLEIEAGRLNRDLANSRHVSLVRWLRDHWIVPLIVTVGGGLLLAWLSGLVGL